MRRRTSILRRAGFLAVATVASIVFIGVTGDTRRQNNAMQRARLYAAELTTRVGDGGRLPLNLSPRKLSAPGTKMVGMKWLSSADAYLLRRSDQTVLAAWTIRTVRAMGADGRAAIFFENGAFSVRWLTLREFARYKSEQTAMTDKLRAAAKKPLP